MFNRKTRKVVDGPEVTFRCYHAMMEARSKNLCAVIDHNYELLKKAPDMRQLIIDTLRFGLSGWHTHVRWHPGGDFFSQEYADAVINAARETPKLIHYFYTKSLPYFTDLSIPDNVFITASWGGKYDYLIEQGYFPRNSKVVCFQSDADALGIPVDHDDSHAYTGEPHAFAHLVHNTQPAGSEWSKAISLRAKLGQFVGYGKTHAKSFAQ